MFNFFKKTKDIEIPDHSLPLDKIKERANILFIDDQKVDLIETLQLEGWHVEYWSDVRSLSDLESGKFDIIFLDIGGIGKEYSPEDEGFGILSRVKKVNPSVLVVAYSGRTFDVTKSQFWSIADDSLSKSAGAIDAIELLEGLLCKKFNTSLLWKDLSSILSSNNVNESTVRRIKNSLLTTKVERTDQNFENSLKTLSLSSNIAKSTLSIGLKILLILKYYNS